MSAETAAAAAGDNSGAPPKRVDACTYVEGQLLFDPNKVLLRRVFFLDPEKTKYISVGFYPDSNYQPLVEIGSPKSTPIVLTDQHVKHCPNTCRLRSTLCGEGISTT